MLCLEGMQGNSNSLQSSKFFDHLSIQANFRTFKNTDLKFNTLRFVTSHSQFTSLPMVTHSQKLGEGSVIRPNINPPKNLIFYVFAEVNRILV